MTAGTTREELLAQRHRVVDLLSALERDYRLLVDAAESSNGDDEHDPEGATVGFERAQLGASIDRTRATVASFDGALLRLDAGSYGRCESCGTVIPPDRLAVRPAATTCVACAR